MMHSMGSFGKRRIFGKKVKDVPELVSSAIHSAITPDSEDCVGSPMKIVTWIAGGFAVVAVGLIAGVELRKRYKFNRRTPYDFYAHSGEDAPDVEFGMGI